MRVNKREQVYVHIYMYVDFHYIDDARLFIYGENVVICARHVCLCVSLYVCLYV